MTEVYLMFYQAALQVFVAFNKFLQREDPIICSTEWDEVLPKKLFGRFVKVDTIKCATEDITSIAYDNPHNQLPGKIVAS